VIFIAHKVLFDQIKGEMGMAADMQANGEEDKFIQNFWLENVKERNHVENHTLHGKIRFKPIMKKLDGTMLTRLIWLSIITDGLCMGMNLWFPHMGNFCTSDIHISFSMTVLCGYCVGCGRGVKGGTYDPNHNITCRS
jgi:hypothetical protein